MKASNSQWCEELAGKMPEALAREIDIFETEIALRKQGKLDERLFAETRLRRGTYGQRYDNGQRHDGKTVQQIPYPSGELTKGPHHHVGRAGNAAHQDSRRRTECDAAGNACGTRRGIFRRHRARDHAAGFSAALRAHRRHAQRDAPAGGRGITTREACGNSVRNVTACPYAGVCPDEVFDVTPYARALSKFLLGHPDCQNFGRKFKHVV